MSCQFLRSFAGVCRAPGTPPHQQEEVALLRINPGICAVLLLVPCLARQARAQNPLPDSPSAQDIAAQMARPQPPAARAYTWTQLLDRFQSANPTLIADQGSVDESRAQEITAHLRPNPQFTLLTDGTQLRPYNGVWRPLAGTEIQSMLSYLHEREHKRELRLQNAQDQTAITISEHLDLERNLVYNLRLAFVQTLQSKATLRLAQDNLDYYDRLLAISKDRFQAGDIAEIDYDRLDLQRVQYESDLETAKVNLRSAKITLQQLLNDRTPVEQFDVTGQYDFSDQTPPLDQVRQTALDNRPDLKAQMQAVDMAQAGHKLAIANGSADPTVSSWWTHNPSFNNPYDEDALGLSVSVPLRIFDRNQGEKLRTQLDIARNQRLADAATAKVFSDVDTAYAQVRSNVALLVPYRKKYLDQATHVRDTITFSYQHGGASLLDLLNAQADYRTVELSYMNLIASYLTSAAQLNLAVGREVLP